MPTEAKAQSIEALKERLGTASSAVLTEYRGLTVRQLSDLRKQLKAASAEYKVVKNRLARIAVKDSHFDPLARHLKGPIGLVIAREDPVSVAKALQAFGRTNPKFAIKVGLVEGKVLEPAEMRALADLPSEQRAVVHLKLWENLTFEQIAEALDISPNTAASRYRYGVDKLRDQLRPLYEEIK